MIAVTPLRTTALPASARDGCLITLRLQTVPHERLLSKSLPGSQSSTLLMWLYFLKGGEFRGSVRMEPGRAGAEV